MAYESAVELVDWAVIFQARRGTVWHLSCARDTDGYHSSRTVCGKWTVSMRTKWTETITDKHGRYLFDWRPTPAQVLSLNLCKDCKTTYAMWALRHEETS